MHGTLSDQSLIYLQIAQMLEDDIPVSYTHLTLPTN